MKQIIIGIIIIIAGLISIVFRKKIVDTIVKGNNKGFGFYNYGKREGAFGLCYMPLFGLLLIAVGILILVGIWELR